MVNLHRVYGGIRNNDDNVETTSGLEFVESALRTQDVSIITTLDKDSNYSVVIRERKTGDPIATLNGRYPKVSIEEKEGS